MGEVVRIDDGLSHQQRLIGHGAIEHSGILRRPANALKDEYVLARKLYPSVDFYSGVIYSAIGIPRSMFTVMFAVARTVGWVANWQEMISDPGMRIGRPRQLYTGAARRDYVDVKKRR